MIESNRKLFLRLTDCAQKGDRIVETVDRARWIHTNEEEKAWLQELELGDVRTLSPRVRTACFSFEKRKYFAVIGFSERTVPDGVFKSADLNAGLFTALIADLEVPILEAADPLEIINEILPEYRGAAETYDGHAFTLVAKFFEPLAIYEIRADSPIQPNDLGRLSCFWTLQNGERLVLPFSQNTKAEIETLTLAGASTIPFDILLSCIQSAQWQHAFLEVYRCIERLFAFQIIENLHRDLALSINLVKFAEKIETAIGWRPREEDAIGNLFRLIPETALNLIEGVRTSLGSDPDEKIHRWVYGLRNSVVHFRPTTQQMPLTDCQWDEMVRATVLLIGKIYGAYDSQLRAA